LRSRGTPIAVSCLLHVALAIGLVVGEHWVSAAIAVRPPVLPVQLITLDVQEEPRRGAPPSPPAPRAPARPPRLIEAPRPAVTAPAATTDAAPPPPPVGEVAPPPAHEPVGRGPALAPVESAPGPDGPATTIVPSLTGEPSARAAVGPSAAIPESVRHQARPQGGYQVRPTYPATPRRLGIQGTTLLRVHVLASGRIGDVLVEKSAGHPELDDAAADAVRRWRFEPARRGSEAVAMWVRLPVEFRLR
jgi:periplasmic protein TonB